MQSASRGGMKVYVVSEHRDNICEKCNVPMELRETVIKSDCYGKVEEKIAKRPVCPKCNGAVGHLISRGTNVQAPTPPICLSPKCLWKFFKDSLFCVLLSSYHTKRTMYAEANRHKQILERYRTGEPSPKNIWQAIHANAKLRCPVCRKYNVDPLLFA